MDDVDAVKGGDVQLVCEIEDQCNPEAASYVWKNYFFVLLTPNMFDHFLFRDKKELEEVSNNITLYELEHEGNYSSAGVNILGVGQEDVFTLEVAGDFSINCSVVSHSTLHIFSTTPVPAQPCGGDNICRWPRRCNHTVSG